jgi:hypothetical protein
VSALYFCFCVFCLQLFSLSLSLRWLCCFFHTDSYHIARPNTLHCRAEAKAAAHKQRAAARASRKEARNFEEAAETARYAAVDEEDEVAGKWSKMLQIDAHVCWVAVVYVTVNLALFNTTNTTLNPRKPL